MTPNSGLRTAIAISLGAIPGALCRYYLTKLTKAIIGQNLTYYGTFLINVTGCLAIAFFITLNEERFRNWSPEIRLMVATGFCGAYTTFSTYGLETFNLLQSKNIVAGLLYMLCSSIIGIVAIKIGVTLARLTKIKKID